MGVAIETVDASDEFLGALAGKEDPEEKRRIIGNLFIKVFWDSVGNAEMLAQGTLYPDVIESASNAKSKASVIKTHHNRVPKIQPSTRCMLTTQRHLGATRRGTRQPLTIPVENFLLTLLT